MNNNNRPQDHLLDDISQIAAQCRNIAIWHEKQIPIGKGDILDFVLAAPFTCVKSSTYIVQDVSEFLNQITIWINNCIKKSAGISANWCALVVKE